MAKVKETNKYNDIVVYYEKEGNFFIPKGTFYAWLYDEEDAGKKISSGEYDFILFPMASGFGALSQKGYVPPLLRIWKKSFQKDKKGIEHLLGIVQGFYDEKNKKMYIEMMTTNPKFRRQGINGHIIKQLREYFEVSQDDVIFDKPTDMGKKFMASKKFDDGGMVSEYTLWGVKKGEPDYMEDLLYVSNTKENFDKVKQMASKDGYNRFRVSKVDMMEKPDFTKAIRKDDGGAINQSTNQNNMDNHKFNQLPHIDTIRIGDHIIIEESVLGGNPISPRHLGERYTRCQIMSAGGMVDSINLKVLNSIGANAIHVGALITRPIANVLQRGRKVIVEPIADAMPKFKEGGLNPDNKNVKEYFAHGSGNVGGVLVGKRHSEGGIKAINKGTGQPLEMEGGEVVITRGAVSNPKRYDFNGKEMTTREILSKLNVDGGGVSFAEGGDVPEKMNCGCNHYKFGGKEMSINDFVKHSENEYEEYRLKKGIEKERKDHYETLSKLNSGAITIDNALTEIARKEMSIDSKYPFSE
jgi:hypothetical protein